MRAILFLIFIFLTGCSGIKSDLSTTQEDFNKQVKENKKARLSVPVIFCKTKGCDEKLAGAVRDLLINELVRSGRFIMVERGESLEGIKKELLLSQSGLVDVKKAVPAGLLEGADLLIVGSITAVEPEKTRFFVPVLIPWREGGRQHFTGGLLEFKKTYIQIFVRLIDVRTGRVIASFRGEGEYTRWDTLLGEGAFKEGGVVGGIQLKKNISVEMAALDLAKKIAQEIVRKIPPDYFRYR
ncbi:CsgG/HfaB family protein [Persephonella sp.]